MNLNHKPHGKHALRGFGLIEVVIATALISGSLIALSAAAHIAFRVVRETVERTQAQFLAEEGLEMVRILRDTGWSSNVSSLAVNTAYYPSFVTTTNTWTLATTDPGAIDGIFTRTVTFFDVYRDGDEDIVVSTTPGATLDTETREALARVEWENGEEMVELRTYMADVFDN